MTWVIFWCSVALALGALAWVSAEVVALERREAESRERAQRQETIRRALWRLDSTMAPVLAVEAARPSSAYEQLKQAPYDGLDADSPDNASATRDHYASRYFSFPSDDLAGTDALGLRLDDTQSSGNTLEKLSDAQLPMNKDEQKESGVGSLSAESDYDARSRVAQLATQNVQPEPSEQAKTKPLETRTPSSNAMRAPARDQAYRYGETMDDGYSSAFGGVGSASVDTPIEPAQLGVPGTLTPRWVGSSTGPKLVLTRTALIDGKPVIQGVELDWDRLRADLLDSISDVLPGATLVPSAPTQGSSIYRMATIPVALIPPPISELPVWSWSPAKVGLIVTWVAIVVTIIAVGVVLRAAIVLSERRGRFVSAVTHELRTPLTTFRLYAQMLADGMVTDEQVRTDYLGTLKRESERLTGIVENVLEYARLTRQRTKKDQHSGEQTLTPGALVARFRPALARRLSQSNLDLVASLDLEGHQERTLTLDPHAVERIMMNLIENACKYAAPSEQDQHRDDDEFDTRVHLDVCVRDDALELLIADHGPGIAPSESARIFGEFQRGRRGLRNARSGLGLGLALSRGLAREMGGDLKLVRRRGHGAEFLLTIPLDPEG